MDKVIELEKKLDAKLSAHPIFERAERQTGIRKTHQVGIVTILVLSSLLSFIFPGLFVAVVSLAFPMLATARAADGHDKAEDVQWLSYWLCYANLLMAEVLLNPLLRKFMSPPIVALLRSFLLVFLFAPQFRGATLVWHQLLRPLLKALESTCPFLCATSSGKSSSNVKNNPLDKKHSDIAKTLNEMRNRSKSGSGEE